MTNDQNNSLSLLLYKGSHGGRVSVGLESFLEFNAQMDDDLRQLVDRWSDFIVPSSQLYNPRCTGST